MLEDGEVLMCESGATVEYLLERYGNGRLAPPRASSVSSDRSARLLGVLAARFPALLAYQARQQGRPALQRTLALG